MIALNPDVAHCGAVTLVVACQQAGVALRMPLGISDAYGAVTRVRQHHSARSEPMVSTAAGGDGTRAPRATPQPSQPPRGQTQDVQVRQETSGTSTPNALEENLCRDCGYYLTNGIALKP